MRRKALIIVLVFCVFMASCGNEETVEETQRIYDTNETDFEKFGIDKDKVVPPGEKNNGNG